MSRVQLTSWLAAMREANPDVFVVALTGCFDLLHVGHLRRIRRAVSEASDRGGILIVGVNSDASVRLLKGPSRPVVAEAYRAELVGALLRVWDVVTIFEEPSSTGFLASIRPSLQIRGEEHREEPETYPTLYLSRNSDTSTTEIIERIKALYRETEASAVSHSGQILIVE